MWHARVQRGYISPIGLGIMEKEGWKILRARYQIGQFELVSFGHDRATLLINSKQWCFYA